MKYKTFLVIIIFQIFCSTHSSYVFAFSTSYINGRVGGNTYYLFNEAYQKLKYKNNHIDKNARAYDLGCGSGNEDVFLIAKGWQVDCIDKNSQPQRIIPVRSKGLPGHFSFQQGDFSQLSMHGKYNFVFAIFSLPFGKKSDMLSIFQTVQQHLATNGFFAFTMNGPSASFNDDGSTFGLTKAELRNLISESNLKINTLLRRKYAQKDFSGNRQQWDVYDVVVRTD
ncbi:hypothetical protein SOPP22_07090 [Shewanella sp. OPT22]|nr:hypothetical protein SOPP22_07090 [Shewanella sp. OPT22]